MDFYDSWHWLSDHPAFLHCDERGRIPLMNNFEGLLDITVAKVNPQTRKIDDDDSKNTHVEIWLEIGPYGYDAPMGEVPGHDNDLDCGGDTFEEAIIELARLVKQKYGDYKLPESVDIEDDETRLPHLVWWKMDPYGNPVNEGK